MKNQQILSEFIKNQYKSGKNASLRNNTWKLVSFSMIITMTSIFNKYYLIFGYSNSKNTMFRKNYLNICQNATFYIILMKSIRINNKFRN